MGPFWLVVQGKLSWVITMLKDTQSSKQHYNRWFKKGNHWDQNAIENPQHVAIWRGPA